MVELFKVDKIKSDLIQIKGLSWKSFILGVILLLTIIFPPLGMAFGASSMAAGLMVVIFFYIALCLKLYTLGEIKLFTRDKAFVFIGMAIAIFIHGLVNYWLHNSFNLNRFLQTFVYLITLGLGAFSFVLVVRRFDVKQVDFILKLVFFLLLLVAWLSILGFSPFFKQIMAVFFYIEPSHFALSFLPFLLYVAVQSDLKYKFIVLILSFQILLLMHNLTLMLGIVFISVLVLNFRNLMLIFVSFSLLFYFNKAVTHLLSVTSSSAVNSKHPDIASYVAERASLSSYNVSVWVFKSGWERAYLNFVDNFGFGIGFQQLGFVGREGFLYSDDMVARVGGKICLFDGGTVAAKFVSEFGIFAIFILGVYVFHVINHMMTLRQYSLMQTKARDPRNVFFLASFIMFSVDMFIRGTGYFSSSSFIFVASLIWITMIYSKLTGFKS